MESCILSLETALPAFHQAQQEVASKMAAFLQLPPDRAALLKRIFNGASIATRHTVIEDYVRNPMGGAFLGSSRGDSNPGMSRRNEAYKKHALPLSLASAERALASWGGPRAAITHVIYVSCTGLVSPGIEFHLMHALDLNRSVQRFGLNFMGCFGAFKGLAMAKAFATENPSHRVLVVCTELCSLQFDFSGHPNSFVPIALFSDGSAAAVIGRDPAPFESPRFAIEDQVSLALDGSLEDMSWEATDLGLQMVLSTSVPAIIEARVRSVAETLLGPDRSIEECDWNLHPGGKAILKVIEDQCGLTQDQTAASWEVLKNCGNMSSATYLFVLAEQLRRETQKSWSLGLGFGPGLSLEGMLLRRLAP